MLISYYAGHYTGFFLFQIVFSLIAIAVAKNGKPWLWYGIGAGVQLFALIAQQRYASYWGMGSAMTTHWIIYFLLLIVAALIIFSRKNQN